jgi:hypothetical protein
MAEKQDLNVSPVGQVTLYDLADGGKPLRRAPVYAREILRMNNGRFVQSPPSARDVEAFQNGHAQATARAQMDAAPAPAEEAPAPTGNARIGLIADAILKLDPAADFNRDGTPDRRKLAGVLHVNSVSAEDTEAAMKLLAAPGAAKDRGGEALPPQE